MRPSSPKASHRVPTDSEECGPAKSEPVRTRSTPIEAATADVLLSSIGGLPSSWSTSAFAILQRSMLNFSEFAAACVGVGSLRPMN